ncbi:MAG: DUF2061 domain-containing protein [Flavobacteriaceae bacterium]|nr:DUF2061 domain-containing protein [Flavobacteriaceae bacterium]MCY4217049.1 DUF2061 domain-containing protein [Flavobacteriaceae bacterium]MCY4253652.1 DUF2061 domain-containing protein [Flavobacteriaceae bacterium]
MLIDILLSKKYSRSSIRKPKKNYSESVIRSVVKAISWRILGTLDTILISYVITGTIVEALSIGFIELVTKMVLYFFHERAWNKLNWGKKSE